MNHAPNVLYFLSIRTGQAEGLGYGVRGGGTFTRRNAAIERGDWLVKAGKIESFTVHKTECVWEVDHVSSAR